MYAVHSIFHARRHTETIKLRPDADVDAQHVQNTDTGQERETDRQTDRQTETERKKGRQKERERERERERESYQKLSAALPAAVCS